ncbi:BlaI/MecI/CopY family transcriptional regulator [Terriglobus aquaticus]|uniref:BlaI/MecI/CopY family transcriptional regulator n=1 Tax=Terriglobus aquaticus TaxID=940139 RepID=A0ABW9KHK1_9BACT|nr:BlaI/MecI/CopY family transcriptional regulator [Terriglobus aquaticus]
MGGKKREGLTPLELKVMQSLWSVGSGTVADVQEQMQPTPAYTTVQTVLNILERKGKLTRTLEGRAYRYRPALSEAKAHSHALRDLVDRMFGGSSEDLVMSLVKTRQLDAKRLASIARKLQQQEDGQ